MFVFPSPVLASLQSRADKAARPARRAQQCLRQRRFGIGQEDDRRLSGEGEGEKEELMSLSESV